MIVSGDIKGAGLLKTLLKSSLVGLASYTRMNHLNLPADYRLAFRELGFSIGLRALENLQELIKEKPSLFKEKDSLRRHVAMLMQYTPLVETIERFWLEEDSREAKSWMDHRDINMVMLATSLARDGFLKL